MITRIVGKVVSKRPGKITLEIAGGMHYEVLVPEAVMRNVAKYTSGEDLALVTYHYFQTDHSKGIPVLIGFLNEIEKEFFEKFITVSGVGPKAACRALALSIPEIAGAIDSADLALLKRLPGIGEQRAKEIIAKLQGKVGKFGLIQDGFTKKVGEVGENVKEEALSVLLQLQYKHKEGSEMIDKALKRNSNIKSSEELLNEVYKAKQLEKR
ncbi:MAG: Holliday junction branch migration protein RuvA [Candidatus Omnitrophota bacterium]